MRFVLKAIFFLAVVAAFIPRQPDGGAVAPADTAAEARRSAGDFCSRKPGLCEAAQESATAARLVGGIAVQQARYAIAESAASAQADAPEDVPAP